MELRICHLYPDALNLYGDRGNVTALAQRLRWRGLEVQVGQVRAGEPFSAGDWDLVLLGDGQCFETETLWADLLGRKAKELKTAVEDGVTVLAIGLGFRLLGQYLQNQQGEKTQGLEILNLHTITGGTKLMGDMDFACPELGGQTVVGFESHDARTFLGEGLRPLGTIMHGYGNNGKDGLEGARYGNVFASNAHGCLLPKNPALADLLLKTALERRYGKAELAPLDDSLELLARDYMEGRISHSAANA